MTPRKERPTVEIPVDELRRIAEDTWSTNNYAIKKHWREPVHPERKP